MKKTYNKPELYFENFSLLGSIAATCTASLVGASSTDACFVEIPQFGMKLFAGGPGNPCDLQPGAGGKVCSTAGPIETMGLFAS